MATSQDFVNWICGAEIEPEFLKYVLVAEHEALFRFASGTTHQTIYYPEAKAFHVCLPPHVEQQAIADIIGALDKKIELNRRMNETLEAMARALFKSWFVDFDPVRAKASDLIRDGILEIGDGYRAKNSELGSAGLPFLRAANLNSCFNTHGADKLCNESVLRAANKISRVGDVAFTSKGTIGRFARVSEYTEKFVYSPQVCYWRSLDHVRLHPAILYCWMISDDLMRQIEAVAGQTDMAPYVSLQDQRRMNVPLLPQAQVVMGQKLQPFLSRQAIGTAESAALAALRDALLPKLISGEIRVKQAEKLVEAAL